MPLSVVEQIQFDLSRTSNSEVVARYTPTPRSPLFARVVSASVEEHHYLVVSVSGNSRVRSLLIKGRSRRSLNAGVYKTAHFCRSFVDRHVNDVRGT